MTSFDLSKHESILPKGGKILVAPLDWGIGHATRCIPIIRQLLEKDYQPILASSGSALDLLQKVFPKLEVINLPAYQVTYAKNPSFFTLKLLRQIPKFIKTYRLEKKIISELIVEKRIDAIISDNRFGVYHKSVPSIYITHQLRVKSGLSTFITSKIHQKIINKYDQCWVPDAKDFPNLSGDLSHAVRLKQPPVYIGILSLIKKQDLPIQYDILFLLSGPEPQRSLLEASIRKQLINIDKPICIVRGIVEKERIVSQKANITTYNFVLGKDLNKLLNQSKLIVARSGYSTLMDLANLKKETFFIPTPGQQEQLYLANHIKEQGIANYALQGGFLINESI
jgi:uncharacterized protein (TIGR00661 family)